jgi:UDPglucose 6-dehydrogenase
LLGSEKTPSAAAAADVVAGILSRWIQPARIVRSNLWSAELSKMAVNAYKAQRVAATFAVSALAERTGAVADDVMLCVGADSRLGASCMCSNPFPALQLYVCSCCSQEIGPGSRRAVFAAKHACACLFV